jgi:ADP-dependent NAD(P)H-hydrate dehydratase / NAD(P)H-hydrate epimerase
MKILSAKQLQQCDRFTIEHEPISSTDLMERAASKCAEWILSHVNLDRRIHIFCGVGNNGGDGLVIARLLHLEQRTVNVYIVGDSAVGTNDFNSNLNKWKALKDEVFHLQMKEDLPEIEKDDLVIDALFGTGLNRPASGIFSETIKHINSKSCEVVSIDLPSGMFSEDNPTNNNDNIVRATHTLTFQCPKLSFFLSDAGEMAGEWHVLDIGLSKVYIKEISSSHFFTEKKEMKNFIKERPKFSHKGTFGHTLIAAGSTGKMGAAVLAVDAAIQTGSGLVTAFIPAGGLEIMQISNPEAMVIRASDDDFLKGSTDFRHFNAIGAGPGIGTKEETVDFLRVLLSNYKNPIVLDADALNILSEHKELLELLPKGSILTPHPKEFDRLFGHSATACERLNKQQQFSSQYMISIVLKGAYTSITSTEGTVFFNSTGKPALSTGGSGDVLTGIISALIAQGYEPLIAARLGVYIHGSTADLWKAHYGNAPMTAKDIVDLLPEAIADLLN